MAQPCERRALEWVSCVLAQARLLSAPDFVCLRLGAWSPPLPRGAVRLQLRPMKVVTGSRLRAELRDAAIAQACAGPLSFPRHHRVPQIPCDSLPPGALSPPTPRVGLRPGFVFLPSSLQPLLAVHLLGQT